MISFDGSYNSLLEISEYYIAFEILCEDINELLYYMRVNAHENINEIKKESIEKIIGELKDDEKPNEDKDQNDRKKLKDKMHIKLKLLFSNKEEFFKTILFKSLKNFLNINKIEKVEKSLNTKLLEHKLDENIMKNFILMLDDIEKHRISYKFLVKLKEYNNYIIKRNELNKMVTEKEKEIVSLLKLNKTIEQKEGDIEKAQKEIVKLKENINDQNERINIARNESIEVLKDYLDKNKIKAILN